jgi:KTSC domain
MNRTKVEVSSNVASVGYDAVERLLEVEFKAKAPDEEGPVYQYFGVDQEIYDEIRDAMTTPGASVGYVINLRVRANKAIGFARVEAPA